MDAKGILKSFNLADGSSIWEQSLKPAENSVYSGAIASDSKFIFVTLGSGELICIQSSDGSEVWRTSVKSPLRGAANVVDGRIYVITIDNKTLSFSAKTGKRLWTHSGASESVALIGGGGSGCAAGGANRARAFVGSGLPIVPPWLTGLPEAYGLAPSRVSPVRRVPGAARGPLPGRPPVRRRALRGAGLLLPRPPPPVVV